MAGPEFYNRNGSYFFINPLVTGGWALFADTDRNTEELDEHNFLEIRVDDENMFRLYEWLDAHYKLQAITKDLERLGRI